MAVAAWLLAAPASSAERYAEAAVKAAFLHRFVDFVEWPPEVADDRPLRIAVMGDADVAEHLGALAQRSATASDVEVVTATRDRQLDGARIVFLGAGTPRDPRALISSLADQPTLVVTDTDAGLAQGAAINFVVIDQRVRFEVSLPAAERARLRISSDMLSVALRVIGGQRAGAQANDADR